MHFKSSLLPNYIAASLSIYFFQFSHCIICLLLINISTCLFLFVFHSACFDGVSFTLLFFKKKNILLNFRMSGKFEFYLDLLLQLHFVVFIYLFSRTGFLI